MEEVPENENLNKENEDVPNNVDMDEEDENEMIEEMEDVKRNFARAMEDYTAKVLEL